MKKKIYNSPLTEVAKMRMTGVILTSPTGDWSMDSNPGHPGAPARRVPALGNDSVQVF